MNKAELLLQLGMRFWEYFRVVELQRSDMSMLRMDCLKFINHNPDVLISELARHLKVSNPSTSIMIDRMVDEGLVSRTHGTNDRRQVHIKLTPKGQQELARLSAEMEAEMEQLFVGISDQEVAAYISTQQKIIANMDRMQSAYPQSPTA